MFDKLVEARQKAEEIKRRLYNITLVGEVEGGLSKVVATANKEVTEVSIDQIFLANADKEELEELLVVAVNNAMKQAENISQAEMQGVAKDMLGGLGGLL